MFLFLFLSNLNFTQEIEKLHIKPSVSDYFIILLNLGVRNLSLSKLILEPTPVFFSILNYVIVMIMGEYVAKIEDFKERMAKMFEGLQESKKYKEDIQKYEKTIEELQSKIVELSSRTLVLKDFASEIGSSFEPSKIFNSIIEATVKLMDAEKSMILILDKNKKLRVKAGHNITDEDKKLEISSSAGIVGMAIKENNVITSEDIEKNFHLQELHKEDKIPIEMVSAIRSEDGKFYAVLVINKMKSSINKEHIRMFSILINIATLSLENAKLFKKVEFMANVDGLTKLYTHRYFQEFLSEELARATRYKRPLSIVMSDIDHFKKFNDTYGHQTGDLVLERTAKIFKASVRNKVDLVARYGGEEFIAVLPETDMKQAFVVAERLRRSVEAAEYISDKGEKLKVTISLGISTFPFHATEKIDLIKKADTALYYAKENGRNQVQIFDPKKMKIVEK
jgi:diguanylate cyclase (GGDEF)-like protein